ncbi:hypothetical protein OG455_30035 [Kitasatospora sp. NBC_01287]|nr:hypothetical protein [Kitasatospora sp. NBC_01287]MCX4749703.1 hypothetical protein [Kitasatospora sp. NBC_01287]
MSAHHLDLIEEARRIAPKNIKVEVSGDLIIMQASPRVSTSGTRP